MIFSKVFQTDRVFSWAIYGLIVVLLAGLAMGQEQSDAIRDILKARMERLENLIVTFTEWTDHSPEGVPPASSVVTETDTGYTVRDSGTDLYNKEFSHLKGMSRFDHELVERDRGVELPFSPPDHIREVRALSRERMEALFMPEGDDRRPIGQIRDSLAPPVSTLETGLAMRLLERGVERLDAESLAKMEVDMQDNGDAVVRFMRPHAVPHEFVLSKNLGYAPVVYRIRSHDDGKVGVEMKMGDFENMGGIMLPRKMDLERWTYNEDGTKRFVQIKKLTVGGYRLNDPENVPERYHIKWPENTLVVDARSRVVYKVESEQLVSTKAEEIAYRALDRLTEQTHESGPPHQASQAPSLSADKAQNDQGRAEPTVTDTEGIDGTVVGAGGVIWPWAVTILGLVVLLALAACHWKKRSRLG
ncbi:MAG: hypothetical protein ACYTEL_06245 [Planctomycetota bacterium]|jgi:hypothetical protein